MILAVGTVGCAPMTKQRRARVIMASGAVGLAGGAVIIACDAATEDCGPGSAGALGVGIPLAVAGAALVIVGLKQGATPPPTLRPGGMPGAW